jgi:hypothetical protein
MPFVIKDCVAVELEYQKQSLFILHQNDGSQMNKVIFMFGVIGRSEVANHDGMPMNCDNSF